MESNLPQMDTDLFSGNVGRFIHKKSGGKIPPLFFPK
jgi:hypothetical protein